MFVVKNLRSISFDFTGDPEISERLFGPDKSPIVPNWFEETEKTLTSIIQELEGSKDDAELSLRHQCYVAMAILTFAKNHGGEIHMVYQQNDLLDLTFEFYDARHAFLFESDVQDYVETTVGLA